MFIKVSQANKFAEGEMRVFDVAGTKVNVTLASGQLHAFDDKCTHMGCSLAGGNLDGTTVQYRSTPFQFLLMNSFNLSANAN